MGLDEHAFKKADKTRVIRQRQNRNNDGATENGGRQL